MKKNLYFPDSVIKAILCKYSNREVCSGSDDVVAAGASCPHRHQRRRVQFDHVGHLDVARQFYMFVVAHALHDFVHVAAFDLVLTHELETML